MGILDKIFGNQKEKYWKKKQGILEEINRLEKEMKKLKDEDFPKRTEELKKKDNLDAILPQAFALAREAALRTVEQRPFDTQLVGAMALHEGKIAEMKTGEGKTLAAVLAAYLNALSGKGVHVVTVNDYLSRRDAGWMGQIYHFLGLSVGCLNHDSAYLFRPNVEDDKSEVTIEQKNLVPVERRAAYKADVLYGTNNEFGFDYLRDNMVHRLEQMVQRGLNFAIVDEVDSILIDEARTPLIISAPDEESTKMYQRFAKLVPRLKSGEDFNVDEKLKSVTLTDEGINKMENWLGMGNIYETGKVAYVHHLEQALKAQILFQKDKEYVVKEGEVMIVDEFTGRLMPGRRYSSGLHQAIEAKEGVTVQRESKTMATITFQNYFRMYGKLAGMTGTALTSAEEFEKVYGLLVVEVPTNQPMVRDDRRDMVYKTERGKFEAIAEEIAELNKKQQPVLVGTIAIEKSEELSQVLKKRGIEHEVLNAKNHEREAQIIARAGQKGAVTIATNMAGRGTDIKLGQGAKELGGLHILGTERHEARRIDNQLRGRAGRQGDPGSSQFFVSLEDELMRRFGGDRMKGLMDRLGLPDDQPIENKLISRSIESAQTKIEGFNFDMRKRVLEYDDVMNKQRETIYRKRKNVLESTNLKDAMLDLLSNEIEIIVGNHCLDSDEENWNVEEIAEELKTILPENGEIYKRLSEIRKEKEKDPLDKKSEIVDFLRGLVKQAMGRKEKTVGEEKLSAIFKDLFLQTIDNLWQDHLEQMEQMREGIGLQGYGQRDPLVMYKKEAFYMFQRLLASIDQTVSKAALRVEEVSSGSGERLVRMISNLMYSGGEENEQFDGIEKEEKKETKIEPIVNDNKVGRNDPCPCGSGKKHKKCCGKKRG